MGLGDIYLQPGAPDPVLPAEAVVRAARRHAPDAGALLEIDESGGEARAYVLEGGIVLKTQRPHRLRPRTSLAKEELFLCELERQGDFPVPRALGRGEVEGIEYLCLTRMEGSAIERLTLDAEVRAAALRDLGRTLRAIHDIDQSVLGASELVPGDTTPAELRTRFAGTFDLLAAALDADEQLDGVVDVREIGAARLAATPDGTAPVAIHSNPGPEHAFADPATGAFTGLIDFGDAYRSHPALDFPPWTDPADRGAVLEGYESAGPVVAGFEDVLLTGLVIAELARAVRGTRSRTELVANLDRLLG